MGRLEGKVAMISGAGSGIGRATAARFAREGARVLIAELDPAAGKSSAEDVRATGGEAIFVETDVTREESVRRAVRELVSQWGRLDVLFNCAGGSIPDDGIVSEVPLHVWDHTISLDLKGTILCCRHAIPEMIQSGGGSIINTSSVVALEGRFPMHIYSAAKGAILSLTRSLAGSHASDGIRANAICPGIVLTDRVKKRVQGGEGEGTGMETHPFSIGEPADIANVVLFLASDESRMITGATIPADGGLSAY